jgi:hypothetical protein
MKVREVIWLARKAWPGRDAIEWQSPAFQIRTSIRDHGAGNENKEVTDRYSRRQVCGERPTGTSLATETRFFR